MVYHQRSGYRSSVVRITDEERHGATYEFKSRLDGPMVAFAIYDTATQQDAREKLEIVAKVSLGVDLYSSSYNAAMNECSEEEMGEFYSLSRATEINLARKLTWMCMSSSFDPLSLQGERHTSMEIAHPTVSINVPWQKCIPSTVNEEDAEEAQETCETSAQFERSIESLQVLTLTNRNRFVNDQEGSVKKESIINWYEVPKSQNPVVRNMSVKETKIVREENLFMEFPWLTAKEDTFINFV